MPTVKVTARKAASGGVRAHLRDPERLKAARKTAGLSQVALAEAAGCHKSLVAALETARTITVYLSLAEDLCEALDVPVTRLFRVEASS